jgi:hypothetical protein
MPSLRSHYKQTASECTRAKRARRITRKSSGRQNAQLPMQQELASKWEAMPYEGRNILPLACLFNGRESSLYVQHPLCSYDTPLFSECIDLVCLSPPLPAASDCLRCQGLLRWSGATSCRCSSRRRRAQLRRIKMSEDSRCVPRNEEASLIVAKSQSLRFFGATNAVRSA